MPRPVTIEMVKEALERVGPDWHLASDLQLKGRTRRSANCCAMLADAASWRASFGMRRLGDRYGG